MHVARYLVGPYNNSWNFMDAVESIEFEMGMLSMWPTTSDRDRQKPSFVGHVVPTKW